MVACSDCGGVVEGGATTCPHCGSAMRETQQRQQPGRQSNRGQGQPGNHQAPQGQQPEQPRGQRPQNQPHEQPRQRSQDTSRRTLLKYGGGAAVVGIGGFLAFDALTGSRPRGPVALTEAYYRALDAGDDQKARSLLHPEGPQRRTFSSDGFWFAPAVDISIDSTEVLAEEDDRATVEADVTMVATGEDGETLFDESLLSRLELRTEAGQWRIWNVRQ
jgi:hypothetical protein